MTENALQRKTWKFLKLKYTDKKENQIFLIYQEI